MNPKYNEDTDEWMDDLYADFDWMDEMLNDSLNKEYFDDFPDNDQDDDWLDDL